MPLGAKPSAGRHLAGAEGDAEEEQPWPTRRSSSKGAAFVKGRLKHLPQGDETREADFQALPRTIDQAQTHYLGMVVTGEDGNLLADTTVHGRPSVNDLATLLAHAMRRPLDGAPAGPGSSGCGGTGSGGACSPA